MHDIDIEDIRQLAGETIFSRGEDLIDDVIIKSHKVTAEQQIVTASVRGQSLYQVKLVFEQGKVVGMGCSCPAFGYQSLCKHCVATALAATGEGSSKPIKQSTSKARKAPKIDGERKQLKKFLMNKDKDELTDIALELLLNDKPAWRTWVLRAQLSEKPLDKTALKKLITKALPKKHLWDYHKVERYFGEAEMIIDIFISHLPSVPSEAALSLSAAAVDRLNDVLATSVDDSAGYRFAVEKKLCSCLIHQFTLVNWTPEKKAQWLLEQTKISRDIYPSIPEDFILTEDEKKAFLAFSTRKKPLLRIVK